MYIKSEVRSGPTIILFYVYELFIVRSARSQSNMKSVDQLTSSRKSTPPTTAKDRDVELGTSQSSESSGSYIFEEPERKIFVAKVYAILSVQIAVTFVIIFALNVSEASKEFMQDYFWIIYIMLMFQLILYCVLVCSESVRRVHPLNLILLTIHTLLFAAMAAWISAHYETFVIWMSFLVTGAVTVGVSLFAAFTPWDVTGYGIYIFIGFFALVSFCIVATIVNAFISVPVLILLYSGISILLLSFYLIYLTQLILGGRKGRLDTTEVIFAVIVLYVTIIEIFLTFLRIVNAATRS